MAGSKEIRTKIKSVEKYTKDHQSDGDGRSI
jgi:hypothetical protein